MDGSDSVGQQKFDEQKELLKKVVDNTLVAPYKSRVALVQFSKNTAGPVIEFGFDTHLSNAAVKGKEAQLP